VKGAGSESLVCRRQHRNAVGSRGCHQESDLRLGSEVQGILAASELLSKSLASPGSETEQDTAQGRGGFPSRGPALVPLKGTSGDRHLGRREGKQRCPFSFPVVFQHILVRVFDQIYWHKLSHWLFGGEPRSHSQPF